jgi:hypothetical protein
MMVLTSIEYSSKGASRNPLRRNGKLSPIRITSRVAMLESSLTLWLPKLGLCICWYSLSATIIKNAAPHPNPTI